MVAPEEKLNKVQMGTMGDGTKNSFYLLFV